MSRERFAKLFTGTSDAARLGQCLAVEESTEGNYLLIDFYSRQIRGTFPREQDAEFRALEIYGFPHPFPDFRRDARTGCYIAQPSWNGQTGRNHGR